jgi:hypothetical protein
LIPNLGNLGKENWDFSRFFSFPQNNSGKKWIFPSVLLLQREIRGACPGSERKNGGGDGEREGEREPEREREGRGQERE